MVLCAAPRLPLPPSANEKIPPIYKIAASHAGKNGNGVRIFRFRMGREPRMVILLYILYAAKPFPYQLHDPPASRVPIFVSLAPKHYSEWEAPAAPYQVRGKYRRPGNHLDFGSEIHLAEPGWPG